MRYIVAMVLRLAPFGAKAAEYALVLNDSERQALIALLDEATKAKGLAVAPNAVYLANKIQSAPVVTDKKDDPAPVPAPAPAPQ